MNANKLKISAIKTDIGYFCQLDYNERYSGCDHCLGKYYFDNKKAKDTHNKSWAKIEKYPEIIEEEVAQPNINFRYELIDKSLESPKFPLVFAREQVARLDEDSSYGDWIWKEEYAQLQSLYELKFDTQASIRQKVDFEFNIILEIDKIKEYGGFSYPIQRSRWESERFIPLTQNDVQHELIDTIIFPDIVLPARKSNLTSQQTYKIIRKHIQDNINPKYAHITSDYDFCFTVKKKIPLAQKIPYQKNIARFGAKKPQVCY